MPDVAIYCQVHQPYRLRRLRVFDIGRGHDYFDDAANRRIVERVAAKCYLPANRLLSENVALGPWVHVGSDLAHVGLARAGDRLTTRGRLGRLFTRKGREYADLDVLVVADGARPILHVRHTAIYQLPEPGPD